MGYDNVQSTWKNFSNAQKSFSSHNYWVTHCDLFEMFQVLWQIPREFSFVSNDPAVFCTGTDDGNVAFHKLYVYFNKVSNRHFLCVNTLDVSVWICEILYLISDLNKMSLKKFFVLLVLFQNFVLESG